MIHTEKFENMLIHNKKMNHAKEAKAINEMKKMFENNEQVVVNKLVKNTGLSRAFFYNNQNVHNELVRLQGLQEGKSFVIPQKIALDKAMEKEIEILKKKVAEKDTIICQMKLEIEKLKKTAKANLLSTLKDL